jgi:hypothetical protein
MQEKIINRNKFSKLFKKLIFMRLLETVGVPKINNNGTDAPFKK